MAGRNIQGGYVGEHYKTDKQVEARDKALVARLKEKFHWLSRYRDEDIVLAYDAWYLTEDEPSEADERDFLKYLEPFDDKV